jgi:hypothetical protein
MFATSSERSVELLRLKPGKLVVMNTGRTLLKRKREPFWTTKINAERSSPRQLWHSIDALLGRERASTLPAVAVDNLHQFFNDRVSFVRAPTDDAPSAIVLH